MTALIERIDRLHAVVNKLEESGLKDWITLRAIHGCKDDIGHHLLPAWPAIRRALVAAKNVSEYCHNQELREALAALDVIK